MTQVGIVGATGAVGEELCALLTERAFPVGRLRAFASPRSVGRTVSFAGEEIPVEAAEPSAVAECDQVFLSAGASSSRALRPALAAAGCRVADNTSAFRLDPTVPLVVPEVNGGLITPAAPYVAVPNCTTILLSLALAPLDRAFGLRRVVVSTYQAVSGAGRQALETLKAQSRDVLAGSEPTGDGPYAFNVLPSIGPAEPRDEGGWDAGEEAKVVAEAQRILGRPDLDLTATCVRVPVFRAHSESVWIECGKAVDPREAEEVLAAAEGVSLFAGSDPTQVPTPRSAAGGDGIQVGRVRRAGRPEALAFFLAGDQLRKGAALNAVQIAERQRAVSATT